MKTLNQFYDDSMGRALLEVPDETGRETRTNLAEMAHGCGTESVQGQSPVDYDGTTMVNDTTNVTNRLIGAHAVTSGHHGTAEPEMRGLYILLTIDNDGGLEVNKYASRLFEERPEVYQTKPVQLALSVYKVGIYHFWCGRCDVPNLTSTLFYIFVRLKSIGITRNSFPYYVHHPRRIYLPV